jgi:PUL domain
MSTPILAHPDIPLVIELLAHLHHILIHSQVYFIGLFGTTNAYMTNILRRCICLQRNVHRKASCSQNSSTGKETTEVNKDSIVKRITLSNISNIQRSPLLFKQASLAALRQKLITTNGQLGPETALSPEQFEHVLSGVQYLQNPVASTNGQEQRSAIEAIVKMVTTWPVDLRFPGLDLLRLYALYQPALLIASLADSDLEAFFRVWANLNELSTVAIPVNKTLETNYMLAIRTYVNLFGSDAGLEYIKVHQLSIYSLLLADGAWQSFKTKNFRLAIATLFLK